MIIVTYEIRRFFFTIYLKCDYDNINRHFNVLIINAVAINYKSCDAFTLSLLRL